MKLLTAATTFSLVYGASASCADYDNEVKLITKGGTDTGGTFSYTLSDEEIMGCVHNPEEGLWTAVGFSSNGMMVADPGEPTHKVVIGGWSDVPSEYDLASKAQTGVTPSASQTVEDASYEAHEDGGMVLKFTKKLVNDGEVAIKANGANKIIFSWGEPMSFHKVYSHVNVNFAYNQGPPEPQTNDEIPPEPATNDEVVPDEPATNDEIPPEPATNDEILSEPATNDEVEPATNDEVEPATNDEVEPATNDEVEPATNDEVEPATNDEVEPATNDEVEPATNDEVEPATNDEVEPATNDEVEPATNDEVDPEPMSGAANNVLAAGTAAMAFVTALML